MPRCCRVDSFREVQALGYASWSVVKPACSIDMEAEYPLFVPPGALATKPAPLWTKREAEDYCEWIGRSILPRTDFLLEFLDEKLGVRPIDFELLAIGKGVVRSLQDPAFTKIENGDLALTAKGRAIAADSGLLLARVLQRDCTPNVRWTILRKPKNAVSYNLPILAGFHIALDPIFGVIGEICGVLRGDRNDDFLLKAYLFWKSKQLS